MRIEIDKFKRVFPDEGKWLCNMDAKTCSDGIVMAKDADHSQWTEISEEEKLQLEHKWINAIDEENETDEYSEAGKILLGVSE